MPQPKQPGGEDTAEQPADKGGIKGPMEQLPSDGASGGGTAVQPGEGAGGVTRAAALASEEERIKRAQLCLEAAQNRQKIQAKKAGEGAGDGSKGAAEPQPSKGGGKKMRAVQQQPSGEAVSCEEPAVQQPDKGAGGGGATAVQQPDKGAGGGSKGTTEPQPSTGGSTAGASPRALKPVSCL